MLQVSSRRGGADTDGAGGEAAGKQGDGGAVDGARREAGGAVQEDPQGGVRRLHTQIAGREDLEKAVVQPSPVVSRVQTLIKLVTIRLSCVCVAVGEKKKMMIQYRQTWS